MSFADLSRFDKIEEERRNLENYNKKVFSFGKKSEHIASLKENFLRKLEEAQRQKDVEKVKLYYDALLRTINLSYYIYHNMLNVIKEDLSNINIDTTNNKSKIDDFFQAYNAYENTKEPHERINGDLLEAERIALASSEDRINKFSIEFSQKIHNLMENNYSTIMQIEDKILREKELGKELEKPSTLFEGIETEKQLHKLIEEEIGIEKDIMEQINSLFKSAEEFIGENSKFLQEEFSTYSEILRRLDKEYERSKDVMNPAFESLVEKGEILETHASKFAGIVVLLSGVGVIASLAGFATAAAIFSAAFGIVATGGEMLQSLPFVKKKVLPKLDQNIKKMLRNGNGTSH